MTYGTRLRRARLAAGKTLDDVAVSIGVHLSLLSMVERGLRPSFPGMTTRKIAEYLGVDPEPLLDSCRPSRIAEYERRQRFLDDIADRVAVMSDEDFARLENVTNPFRKVAP